MNSKKKAFTLTELLIVVIVIGVLSAVVLPKFNKVMETRKTTEAEEVMAAIRTEQEQRCAFNKKYAESFSQLGDVLASNDTNNYTYSLTREGVTASSKGSYSYNLQMPSFADGRICCDTQAPGNECAKLNKDYPACHELITRADYMASASECRAPCNPPEGNTTYTEACEEGYSGNRTYTWNNATCSYSETSNTCVCTPTHSGQETYNESCGAGYSGSKTYTWSYSSCSYSETNNTCTCTPTHNGQETYNDSCGAGYSGSKTYTWSYSECTYKLTNNTCTCTPTHNGQSEYSASDCPSGYTGLVYYQWNSNNCSYQETSDTCVCAPTHNGQTTYTASCSDGYTGTITYTWNTSSCSYSDNSSTACTSTSGSNPGGTSNPGSSNPNPCNSPAPYEVTHPCIQWGCMPGGGGMIDLTTGQELRHTTNGWEAIPGPLSAHPVGNEVFSFYYTSDKPNPCAGSQTYCLQRRVCHNVQCHSNTGWYCAS